MKIAITGSTGFVGQETVTHFQKQGHTVTRCVRKRSNLDTAEPVIKWDIAGGEVDMNNLDGHDVVIHLAGANIAGKKWTPEYKNTILSSRIEGTSVISEAVAKMSRPPKVFLCASAVGYYGAQPPEKEIVEGAEPAEDFLADVCVKWEAATDAARNAGVRVVNMRFGTVLGKGGGALAKMLPVFQFGLGGVLGSGRQPMSWVALGDVPHIMDHCIEHEEIRGPVNFVSPNPVTNRHFTKILGKVIHRPAFLPVPAFGLRLLYGEMADALLLNGAKIMPGVLERTGYDFRYPHLESALEAALH